MQAFLDHKVADQNSGAASSNGFSLGTGGEVKGWRSGRRLRRKKTRDELGEGGGEGGKRDMTHRVKNRWGMME